MRRLRLLALLPLALSLACDGGGGGGPVDPVELPEVALREVLGGLERPVFLTAPAGLLFVADVGQGRWEEVNVVGAAEGGLNYGWNRMEGAHCYPEGDACDRSGLVTPALEYSHAEGCSVTGGHVYRGSALPGLRGHYFYADYCSGWIRSFRLADGRATEEREWDLGDVGNVSSFGDDSAGELYVVSHGGSVHRLEAR